MVPFYVTVLLVTVVNSQSLPQFESGGRILTNNSYIYYAYISDGDSALKCVTDSDNCCNDSHVGNWTDERGRAVQQGADEATCLYVTRGHRVVSLNRKSDCIPERSGLWRCDIPDSSEVMQSIYIYIGTFGPLRMQSSIEFLLHTEPYVSPPEFTIICLTEGGPATTVLWKRPNGAIVQQGDSDHETSQNIVDTRNSTYENRLRVRGREGGRWACKVNNNIKDYFRNSRNGTLPTHLTVEVPEEPTRLSIRNRSNSTHVNITVTWEIVDHLEPGKRVTGYVIYYQAKGGKVSSVMVSGSNTKRYLLKGLQRGVTYNISIVALSRHLPSPLAGPVTLIPEPILILEVSSSSVTISPNDQFTVTCTARAEVDGQARPSLVLISWNRISKSPSGLKIESLLSRNEYTRTGSPESGYQSILTTTENDTVNMIIYRCRARIPTYHVGVTALDVTVTFKGVNSTSSSKITTTSIPSIETTATSTTSCIATTKTTPSTETTAATSTPNRETINSEITATTTSRVNLNPPNICKISSNHETMMDTVVPIEETPTATEAGHCGDMEEVSCTDNTVVVLGSVGGVMGLIIFIQTVVLVILLLLPNKNSKAENRTSTESEDEPEMVVTSSNAAYGVVTACGEHEYALIELQPTHT